MNTDRLRHALAEPHAFALVTWPAAAALLVWPDWPLAARVALAVWLAALHLAAYSRGSGFGNAMLLASGIVAGAVHYHPSPWAWLAFPALLITLGAAQSIVLKRWQETQ